MFFALVEDGVVLDVEPQKADVLGGLEHGASLRALSTELHRRLAEAAPHAAALLQPTSYEGGPKAIRARVGAETIFRLTAHAMSLDVELLPRATARKRMGLGASGQLDAKIRELIPVPVGNYWNDGRRLAAFCALACERGNR